MIGTHHCFGCGEEMLTKGYCEKCRPRNIERMKRIPLEPKDIPPGSCIRWFETQYWFQVIQVHKEYVYYIDRQIISLRSLETLLQQEAELYHPVIYPQWVKCYKEVLEDGNINFPIICL